MIPYTLNIFLYIKNNYLFGDGDLDLDLLSGLLPPLVEEELPAAPTTPAMLSNDTLPADAGVSCSGGTGGPPVTEPADPAAEEDTLPKLSSGGRGGNIPAALPPAVAPGGPLPPWAPFMEVKL